MTKIRLSGRLTSLLVGVTTMAVAGTTFATPAMADDAVAPLNSQLVIAGAGWGHGRGMSQYGAYGAASQGLTYDAILAFYYPNTTLGSLEAGNQIRVWISGDTDGKLHFRPAAGLTVSDANGTALTLPTSKKYTKWRVSRSSGKRALYYRNKSGKYVKYRTTLDGSTNWLVSNANTGMVKLAMPSGATISYRGTLGLAFTSSGPRTVNYLSMEDYLRSVVPSEMPASWHAEALKAQAVAARTYAAKLRSKASSTSGYDVCDTTACQVYRGVAREAAGSNAAIDATANTVVLYQGKPALTEFSSSNGGWAADGGVAYLTAHADPYDGVKRDQSWVVTVSSAKLAKLFPGIGTLVSVQVLAREGGDVLGGRVTSIKITGSSGSKTVSGADFKRILGLRERLFAVTTTTDISTLGLKRK